MSGFFESGNRSILGLVGLCRQSQISKESIVAIGCWFGETLAIHGNNAFADFSRGFGNQLFEPCAEIGNSWRSDDRNFVQAMIRGDAQDGSQDDARIGMGGDRSATRLDHLFDVLEEFCNIQPHDGGRNHAEIGNRGIAATDARHTHEDFAEFICFSDLLHLRARVGDGDEAVASFFFSYCSLHALEKILLVNIGLERAARLARDDANSVLEIHFRFDGHDLSGIGGIENVQFGKTLNFSKRHAQNFGAEAGAAHAQQKSMLEARLLHVLGDLLESINVRKLLFGDGEPAEPITFVCATP